MKERLQQQVEGRRKPATPKQIYDVIHKADKTERRRRRRHTRKQR